MKTYIYHYCAHVHQYRIDGIVQMKFKVIDQEGYRKVKDLIADFDLVGFTREQVRDKMHISNFSLLSIEDDET